MNNNKITSSVLIILIIGVLTALYLGFTASKRVPTTTTTPNLGIAYDIGVFPTFSTSTGRVIGTSSGVIMATSTGRSYALIINDGASTVYLGFNGNPAVLGQGVRLTAQGGSFEIDNQNMYTGAVTAIASSSASNVTILAK